MFCCQVGNNTGRVFWQSRSIRRPRSSTAGPQQYFVRATSISNLVEQRGEHSKMLTHECFGLSTFSVDLFLVVQCSCKT
jgi:hypothetical protein